MFCPFPPSVDVTLDINVKDPDTIGQPLDYMSYFVDDYLMNLADNEIDTTDFFRQYMAGFLISTRETALSICRAGNIDSVNTDICQMILATELVRNVSTFIDSLPRQDYQRVSNCTKKVSDRIEEMDGIAVLSYQDAVECAFEDFFQPNDTDFPTCTGFTFQVDVDSETFTFVSDNVDDDVSQIEANFSVDGAVRDHFAEEGGGHFGRVHYAPTSTQITGATVYYNNQVRYY